jgi:signal peptidase I
MRRMIVIITKLCFGLLIAVSLFSAAILGYVRVRGLQLLSVQTGSMRPEIRPGDAVLVRRARQSLAPGDIISYQSLADARVTITHRVVSVDIKTGIIITKGDALQLSDPPIGSDRVIGKVERIVPVVGHGVDFIRRPAGLIIAVYLPGIVLTGTEIRRLMTYYVRQHYRLYAYQW